MLQSSVCTGQCHWPAVAAGCTELVLKLEMHKQVMCLDAGSNAQLPNIHFFVQPADSKPISWRVHSSNSEFNSFKRTIMLHGVDHNLSKPGLADGLDSLVCRVI